eukprot:SAG22_NODE_1224_length_5119_cov_2.362550_2_plen_207_part_00
MPHDRCLQLYFAREPGYSHIYATSGGRGNSDGRLQTDEREMMLAKLLVGTCIEMDRDSSNEMREACGNLVTPPHISGCTAIEPSEHMFFQSDGNASQNGRYATERTTGDGILRCNAPPIAGTGMKYNTVRGFTQTDRKDANGNWSKNMDCPKSMVWIVYENGRAYPEYLVRYYRGERDEARTPFATREDAGAPAKTGDLAGEVLRP